MRRRSFLAGTAATGVGLALPAGSPAVAAAASASAAPASAAPRITPFPLSSVTLLDGRFSQNMGRTCAYLLFVDPDRLLYTFLTNVGLPSSAQPCGGWEAPDIQIRGHSTGHLLSALAQANANTGDDAYAAKARYIVGELATCQAASPAAGYNTGYLSAFEESVFDQLEAGGSPWAPYYAIHKIMAGLLDQYQLCGNQQAMDVLLGLASWVNLRTGRLTYDQMQTALHVEFGGMNDVLASLYLVTGDPAHLETAERFDHAAVYDPLAQHQDALNGLHANTTIPKIVGAVREYEATGQGRYLDIARYFWDAVIGHHTYAIGGVSNAEYFCPPDQIVSQLADNTCENCCSYNLLKLTRLLFTHDPGRADYMDYYERTLFNQMLGEQDPDSAHGFCTYYTGLWAGVEREPKSGLGADPGTYSSDYTNFSCDHGTGMETNTKFFDTIYFRSENTLYVNLFIASTLTWSERGVTVRQDTAYPQEPGTRLTITGGGRFGVAIRIPAWVSRGGGRARVRVNGVPVAPATAGRYLLIDRPWRSGDVVEATFPMAPVWQPAPDNPHVASAAYGPLVLGGAYGSTALAALPAVDPASLRRDDSGSAFTFDLSANGTATSLLPFADIQHQRYNVYWLMPAPRQRPRLLAHYPFDEGSGTTAADATRTWPDASLVAGATWTDGRLGTAVALDGAGSYVALPPGLLSGLSELTVSAWVWVVQIANSARVFDLGFGKLTYMYMTPRTGNGTARFATKMSGMDAEDVVDASVALPTGAWTHVAVTIADQVGTFYVNGVESGRNPTMVMSPLALGATSQNYLGKSQDPRYPFLNGRLDDFRLYNYALAAAEVAELANS